MREKFITDRCIVIFLLALAAITQAGLVLYTPAFSKISIALHISFSLVGTTLTGYLFGFGISQLFYGVLSDRYGRKAMLITGLIIFNLGVFWNIFVNTYEQFLVSRIIQGIGLGACMTLSRSILRDCFSGKEYIKVASYLSSGFAIGMGLTPVIGGHLLDFFTWRAEFIFLFISGMALLICVILFLPETNVAKNKIKEAVFFKNTVKDCFLSLRDISFLGYLFVGVMAYGVIIAYNTMSPFLFQSTLKYSPQFYGWLTFIVAIVYYLGTSANRKMVVKYDANFMIKLGLWLIILSGLGMLLSHLIFHYFNLFVIFIPTLIATFGQALIWSNCIAGALKDLSHIAGTASAVFGSFQMLLSAVVSALVAMPISHNQMPFALVIIALGVISAIGFKLCVLKNKTLYKNSVIAYSDKKLN